MESANSPLALPNDDLTGSSPASCIRMRSAHLLRVRRAFRPSQSLAPYGTTGVRCGCFPRARSSSDAPTYTPAALHIAVEACRRQGSPPVCGRSFNKAARRRPCRGSTGWSLVRSVASRPSRPQSHFSAASHHGWYFDQDLPTLRRWGLKRCCYVCNLAGAGTAPAGNKVRLHWRSGRANAGDAICIARLE